LTGRKIAPAVGRDLTAVHIHERIRRGLGIKGGNAVSSLGDELVPVIIVDDLTSIEIGASLIRQFTMSFEFVPVNEGQVMIFNPLGSRTRVLVRSVFRFAGAAAQAFWRRNDSTAGFVLQSGVGSGALWSHDIQGSGVASGFAGSRTQLFNQDIAFVPTISGGWNPWTFGASNPPWPLGVVLGEGQGVSVSLAVAGATSFTFEIVERDLEP